MKQTINILSNNVINQIAAGEVIQRPASVVKELIENAIDAQAENIHIIIKNSGKSFIQIIDDGKGMTKKDAEICFLKHTTSKIKSIDDIMEISTMGFRGEALASIASVSEVELKTKTEEDESGTVIHIDNSKIKKISKTAVNKGTSIIVKNMFFNIPARKKFLKSDKIETKHILETFIQIAIANHFVKFKLTNEGQTIYNLASENLKNRIISIFGKRYNQKILQIQEQTTIVSINGFLGNPLDAKKTRGEQFLYVNNRFIKSSYLNHAIKSSMEYMITKEQHPSYFIFLNISPKLIDINVHPNKTEVKFEDEKSIYQILKSACKRSIGLSPIQPSLDFSVEKSFEIPVHTQNSIPREPKLNINTNFNPFTQKTPQIKANNHNAQELFSEHNTEIIKQVINIDSRYAIFITHTDNSINMLDKKKAMERILYEKTIDLFNTQQPTSQFLIKPMKIALNIMDIEIIKDNVEIINKLGYQIQNIEHNSISISAIPNQMTKFNTQEVIEIFIEELKQSSNKINKELTNNIAKKIAYNNVAIKQNSDNIELHNLITQLMECETPFIGIDGKPCVINIEPNKFFN